MDRLKHSNEAEVTNFEYLLLVINPCQEIRLILCLFVITSIETFAHRSKLQLYAAKVQLSSLPTSFLMPQ